MQAVELLEDTPEETKVGLDPKSVDFSPKAAPVNSPAHQLSFGPASQIRSRRKRQDGPLSLSRLYEPDDDDDGVAKSARETSRGVQVKTTDRIADALLEDALKVGTEHMPEGHLDSPAKATDLQEFGDELRRFFDDDKPFTVEVTSALIRKAVSKADPDIAHQE